MKKLCLSSALILAACSIPKSKEAGLKDTNITPIANEDVKPKLGGGYNVKDEQYD